MIVRVDGNTKISEWGCTNCGFGYFNQATISYNQCPKCEQHNDTHKNSDLYKWALRKVGK